MVCQKLENSYETLFKVNGRRLKICLRNVLSKDVNKELKLQDKELIQKLRTHEANNVNQALLGR